MANPPSVPWQPARGRIFTPDTQGAPADPRTGRASAVNADVLYRPLEVQADRERRRQFREVGANGLLSGGGRAVDPFGAAVDPNALPQWDPLNAKTGAGTAYFNLLTNPSGAMQLDPVAARVNQDLTTSGQPRAVPLMPQMTQAVSNIGSAGADFAAQQRQLANAAAAPNAGTQAQQQLLGGMGATGAQAATGQRDLASLLAAQAAGQGPSAAQAVLQQGLSRNIGAQAAMAANARGGNAAAAMRNAQLAGQEMSLQTQAQSAALRAQEQQAAQALLGDVLGTTRGQDLGTLSTQGQLAGDAAATQLAQILGAANVAGGARGQDIGQQVAAGDAAVAASNTALAGRGLDDAQGQNAVLNALGLGNLQLQGSQADNNMRLQAAQILNNYLLGRRSTDIAKQGADLEEFNAMTGLFKDGASSVGSMIAGAG